MVKQHSTGMASLRVNKHDVSSGVFPLVNGGDSKHARSHPYVGVTGVTTPWEMNSVLKEFADAGYSMQSPHVPMVGILVSQNSLWGRNENARYPAFGRVWELLGMTKDKAFATIHYDTRNPESLAEQLFLMLKYLPDPALCNGIQLNIRNPQVEEIVKFKMKYPDIKFILQMSTSLTEGKEPSEVAAQIRAYSRSIDYALIDSSEGKGLPIDFERVIPLYEQIHRTCPDLTVGFAGGLDGGNAREKVRELMKHAQTEQFSVDAEDGLRDKKSAAHHDDALNLVKVRAYLHAVSRVIR